MGTEKPDQILLTTIEIGGSVMISNTLRTDTENRTDTTIQPTIVHLRKSTGPGQSDRNHFPIGSLNSGIDVTISGRNIDNRTGMKPQGTIVTTIPESKRMNNCKIFDSISRTSDLAYRGSLWHVTKK